MLCILGINYEDRRLSKSSEDTNTYTIIVVFLFDRKLLVNDNINGHIHQTSNVYRRNIFYII